MHETFSMEVDKISARIRHSVAIIVFQQLSFSHNARLATPSGSLSKISNHQREKMWNELDGIRMNTQRKLLSILSYFCNIGFRRVTD